MASANVKSTVKDVMSKEPVCVEPSTPLHELARLFEENEISGAPVVDVGGTLVGVVSKTDLIRHALSDLGEGRPVYLFEAMSEQSDVDVDFEPDESVAVEDVMSGDAVTATPDEPLHKIAKRMCDERVHRVIVIDGERYPIGIVTSLDVLSAFPH